MRSHVEARIVPYCYEMLGTLGKPFGACFSWNTMRWKWKCCCFMAFHLVSWPGQNCFLRRLQCYYTTYTHKLIPTFCVALITDITASCKSIKQHTAFVQGDKQKTVNCRSHPTDPFTSIKLQNCPSTFPNKIFFFKSPNFGAIELWKNWSDNGDE